MKMIRNDSVGQRPRSDRWAIQGDFVGCASVHLSLLESTHPLPESTAPVLANTLLVLEAILSLP
jgi:hypothetical protein